MNQTEAVQSLIDTYTSNGMSHPSQIMPNLDFPIENNENLVRDDKFLKPLWYLPAVDTPFSRGTPVNVPTITKPVVVAALRKSISGLLRLKGFNGIYIQCVKMCRYIFKYIFFLECNESALVMLMDGVDEFFKCLLESVNNVLLNENRDVIVSNSFQNRYFFLNSLSK